MLVVIVVSHTDKYFSETEYFLIRIKSIATDLSTLTTQLKKDLDVIFIISFDDELFTLTFYITSILYYLNNQNFFDMLLQRMGRCVDSCCTFPRVCPGPALNTLCRAERPCLNEGKVTGLHRKTDNLL